MTALLVAENHHGPEPTSQLRLIDPGLRVCSKCGEAKPPSEFLKDERNRQCKACLNKLRRAYCARNREKVRAWGKAYYERNRAVQLARDRARRARNREATRAYDRARRARNRDLRLRRKYGISAEEYDAILSIQGGGCWICGRSAEEDGRNLAVDHDHATGEVRGILCAHHNTAVGSFRDREQWLRRTIEYLQLPRRWWELPREKGRAGT